MAVTVLALLFLLAVGAIAAVGYKFVIRRNVPAGEEEREKCSLCRQSFTKSEMVLRQVGDTKLLYFCRSCIMGLYSELGLKN